MTLVFDDMVFSNEVLVDKEERKVKEKEPSSVTAALSFALDK